MPGCRINPPKRNVFSTIFCTCAKNIQLELQWQRPADSDAPVPKHLSLSPATAVGVISAAAVQSPSPRLCAPRRENSAACTRALAGEANRQSRPVVHPASRLRLLDCEVAPGRLHKEDGTNLSRCFLEGNDDRVISTSSPPPSGVGGGHPRFGQDSSKTNAINFASLCWGHCP